MAVMALTLLDLPCAPPNRHQHKNAASRGALHQFVRAGKLLKILIDESMPDGYRTTRNENDRGGWYKFESWMTVDRKAFGDCGRR